MPNSGIAGQNVVLAQPATDRILGELDAAAKMSERLVRDVERVEEMRVHDFTGARYEAFADDVCRYGIRFLNARLRTGEIVVACAERGRPVRFTEEDLKTFSRSRADREDLAVMTVTQAILRFTKQALRDGGWDPQRGALLTTYFCGLCLLVLGDTYRAWRTQHHDRVMRYDKRLGIEFLARAITPADSEPSSRQLALAQAVVTLAENERSQHTRVIVQMTAQGQTQNEIADHLGLTRKQVEGRLRRFREKAKSARERGTLIPFGLDR
ncbi:putative transcriptional rgulator [Embleya hyalina]|uniref:Putative transcriptional rgulator n=2 Tax=Embleya hyalina TaxID=516124 RepID=A0A401YYV9_9ACTN|nr:putative transcriptional rgulator [Embleya hyalina]